MKKNLNKKIMLKSMNDIGQQTWNKFIKKHYKYQGKQMKPFKLIRKTQSQFSHLH